MLMATLVANAQVENAEAKINGLATERSTMDDVPTPAIEADDSSVRSMGMAEVDSDTLSHRHLYVPSYAYGRPTLFTSWMPMGPFGWGSGWDLHEGLNAQVGMGVMVGFGKGNPFKGASFFTDASLAYAKQIDRHWSVALGGTLSRFKMWDKNEWSGNLFGIANYQFDEHWSASVYASYNHMPLGADMFGFQEMAHFNENFARFGGEVTYKFNENCAISVGVSTDIPTGNNRPWLPPQHSDSQWKNQTNGSHDR